MGIWCKVVSVYPDGVVRYTLYTGVERVRSRSRDTDPVWMRVMDVRDGRGEWGEIYGIRCKMSLEYTKFERMNQVDVLMWRGR